MQVLNKESFLTILLLMKLFMDVEAIPTILGLIKEVPVFKKFIEDGIVVQENALLRPTKVQQFKFYIDARKCPLMKYNKWLPQDGGIKL